MPDVVITPTSQGKRGPRYQVAYLGSPLIESTLNPEFDACRALLALGITGKLTVWRRGGSTPCMTLDIEQGADLTVAETDGDGPRLVRWRPFAAVDAQNAVSSRAGSSRTAAGVSAVPTPARRDNRRVSEARNGKDSDSKSELTGIKLD